jgi:Domain of unknown function (DUF4126)
MSLDTLIDLCIGIGLSAAAGLRLLVPFFILSLAALFGHFPISPDIQWVNSLPALETLGLAVAIEVLAYFIPWLDAALDVVALPVSILAGTVLTAAFATDLDPFLQWSLAILAGGGIAGAMRGLTGFSRLLTTTFTGGLANFAIAILEVVGAVLLSILAIVLPGVAIITVMGLLAIVIRIGLRIWPKPRQLKDTETSTEG